MKIYIFCLIIGLCFVSCSSSSSSPEDNLSTVNSNILIDGIQYLPTSVKVVNGTPNSASEASLVFSLLKANTNSANNESLVFKINYPLTSSSAPNGVYDFGIGVTGTMLFAQGNYTKGSTMYSLAGYTVKVTSLGSNNYQLEFQNIQAVNINNGSIVIISGFYQGQF